MDGQYYRPAGFHLNTASNWCARVYQHQPRSSPPPHAALCVQAIIAIAVNEDWEERYTNVVLGNYTEPPARMLFSARLHQHNHVGHKEAGRAT